MQSCTYRTSLLSGVIVAVMLLTAQLAFAAAGCDGSGNCYIRAGATGTGSGANWTNAYTGFGTTAGKINPAGMARGVTYWIAAGSYGSVTFSTPNSSTAVITLKSATAGNHGPALDWNNAFAGQALFLGSPITTGYWTFDGQQRGSDWQSGYLLKFWNKSNGTGAAVDLSGANTSNLTFRYVEMEGTGNLGGAFPNNTSADRCGSPWDCSAPGGPWWDNAIYTGGAHTDNLYLGYSFVHHTGNTQFQMNGAVNQGSVWEYNWVSYNHTGQNGNHDEAYSLYGSNVSIRYNVFQNICSTGVITTAGGGNPSLSNWEIYGNLFYWDASYAALAGRYQLATIDNGIVDFLGETMSGYVRFYNNTIAGFNNSVATAQGTAFATNAIAGVGQGYNLGSPIIQIYNNLWWNSAFPTGGYSDYNPPGSTRVSDYNSYYQGSVPTSVWAGYFPSETHGQVFNNSTNPFANAGASSIAGFELSATGEAGMNAGTSLAAPYNMDLFGILRGSNGKWDRGALQVSATASGPAPPESLTVTNVQ